MALEYQIQVKVHQKWVSHFQDTKLNLCTSFGMKSNYSKVNYNIIATSEDTTEINTISWNEEYAIAARKDDGQFGRRVYYNTNPAPISFGQSFAVKKNWTVESPNPNPLAPAGGMLFANDVSAAALMFKNVDGAQVPVYTTCVGGGTPPPGRHTLTPDGTVIVFFMAQVAGTAFNIDAVNTMYYKHSYVEQKKTLLEFDEDGVWKLRNATARNEDEREAKALSSKL